ncbi:MAG TPA: hypothetical protein VGO50_08325 [Pyrinomonadaceae bacterium]|jgi:hypothetical protein|nr:hypothetical protein [Pyrinomonadaceae bacterium]
MKTQVEIKILGLAICYRKMGENWKVLLPWNSCHRILFSYGRDGTAHSAPVSLAVAGGVVKVSTQNAISSTGQTAGFEKEVFNFTTNAAASGYDTHQNISLKGNWRDKTVALEIENAFFAPNDYVNVITTETIFRNGLDADGNSVPRQQISFFIAHSLKALITLNENGILTVLQGVHPQAPATEIARIPANGTPGGGKYTIIFDNDCDNMNPLSNDMLRYYENTIVDGSAANSQEKYWIGSIGTIGAIGAVTEEIISERSKILNEAETRTPILFSPLTGVFLVQGKPCMGGQVSPAPQSFP